jgi:hypothetical protein
MPFYTNSAKIIGTESWSKYLPSCLLFVENNCVIMDIIFCARKVKIFYLILCWRFHPKGLLLTTFIMKESAISSIYIRINNCLHKLFLLCGTAIRQGEWNVFYTCTVDGLPFWLRILHAIAVVACLDGTITMSLASFKTTTYRGTLSDRYMKMRSFLEKTTYNSSSLSYIYIKQYEWTLVRWEIIISIGCCSTHEPSLLGFKIFFLWYYCLLSTSLLVTCLH